jgi:molybdopterin converting factor small subunit
MPTADPSSADRGTGTAAVRVGLFAGMAEAAGRRSIDIPWEGGSIAELKARLAAELPAIVPLLARSAVAIGAVYAPDDAPVPPGAEVAIIPPVSGG